MKKDSIPTWRTYACRYYHNGKWWALDLVARDEIDAESRVCKLGNLQLLGEIKMEIPASVPGAGLFTQLITRIRNWAAALNPDAIGRQTRAAKCLRIRREGGA
jgi:hypothetical protein